MLNIWPFILRVWRVYWLILKLLTLPCLLELLFQILQPNPLFIQALFENSIYTTISKIWQLKYSLHAVSVIIALKLKDFALVCVSLTNINMKDVKHVIKLVIWVVRELIIAISILILYVKFAVIFLLVNSVLIKPSRLLTALVQLAKQ